MFCTTTTVQKIDIFGIGSFSFLFSPRSSTLHFFEGIFFLSLEFLSIQCNSVNSCMTAFLSNPDFLLLRLCAITRSNHVLILTKLRSCIFVLIVPFLQTSCKSLQISVYNIRNNLLKKIVHLFFCVVET